MGRDNPLELYGPEGVTSMAAHVVAACEADIRYRVDGLEPANDQGWRVNAHEIGGGAVYGGRPKRPSSTRHARSTAATSFWLTIWTYTEGAAAIRSLDSRRRPADNFRPLRASGSPPNTGDVAQMVRAADS